MLTYTGTACHNIRRVNITDILNEHHVSVQCRSGFPCKVRFHIDQPLPKIKADLAQVQQVIDNVVQNAAEAIDFDGVIEVSASFYENVEGAGLTDEDFPAGGYVRVDVKDNGPGMSPNVVAKAFDPFFTTKFLGRGLGLSAVLGIMRAHNGAVLLETAPDLGTTVHLFFPVDSPKHNFAIGLQRSTTEPNGAA